MPLSTLLFSTSAGAKPFTVWDAETSGAGSGPFTFTRYTLNASGSLINPATAEKQPALGTAGTPSTDVLTVQGISGGTALNIGLSSGAISATDRLPVDDRDGLTATGSVTSATTIFTLDLLGYQSVSVQITSAGSGNTIVFEASDDNSTWLNIFGVPIGSRGDLLAASSSTAIGLWQFRRSARYFRARVFVYGSGTVTALGTASRAPAPNVGSVNIGNTTLPVTGAAGHGIAISGNPVRLGARALTAAYTAVATGQTADLVSTLAGALVVRPNAIPESEWSYAAATNGIVNTTTAVQIAAAAGAGLRNYVTGFDISHDTLGGATEIEIRNTGGAVLWRGRLQTAARTPMSITLAGPLRGAANTALEVATTTAVTGGVYVNVRGYVAP